MLKQTPCRRWLEDNLDPHQTVLYVGLEPSELRREPGIVAGWQPWRVEFPLLHNTSATKDDLLAWCRACGLTPPRLYRLGFSHNNCGGLCVRGGQAHWRRTLREFPDRFRWYEKQEQQFRAEHGDVATLKHQHQHQHQGRTTPLSLQQLRTDTDSTDHRDGALVNERDLAHCMRILGLGELPQDLRRRLAVTTNNRHQFRQSHRSRTS